MENSKKVDREHLLPIGVVAKSFGVNENTIRRLEAAGLFQPAYISESGYRYYDSDNISLLADIFSLRSFGFVYDDLKEYYKTPGDYSVLYEKLLERQSAINLLVHKFGRRLNNQNHLRSRFIHFTDADCLYRKERMLPSIKGFFDFSKSFLFDTIRMGYPIDYTRSLMILSDCMDYKSFRLDVPQTFTFCIPADGSKIDQNKLLHIPASNAVSCGWSSTMEDSPEIKKVFELFDREFEDHQLRQSATLRAAFDISGYMRSDAALSDTVLHIMVPVE